MCPCVLQWGILSGITPKENRRRLRDVSTTRYCSSNGKCWSKFSSFARTQTAARAELPTGHLPPSVARSSNFRVFKYAPKRSRTSLTIIKRPGPANFRDARFQFDEKRLRRHATIFNRRKGRWMMGVILTGRIFIIYSLSTKARLRSVLIIDLSKD